VNDTGSWEPLVSYHGSSTKCAIAHDRKYPKKNHPLSVWWRHFLWHHVKSGSHTTSCAMIHFLLIL
jgi:hypothetical protein